MGSTVASGPHSGSRFRLTDLLVVLGGGLLVFAAIAMFVVTDEQRIERLIDTALKAFESGDVAGCMAALDENEAAFMGQGATQESLNSSQIRLLLERTFAEFPERSIRSKRREIVVSDGTARVTFTVGLSIQNRSLSLLSESSVRGTLGLVKHSGNLWRIRRIEVIEIRGGGA
ncbi:MAG: nuclear transport factor 2 family protein [Candidatus Wallbacteria bacterium]|nr:nuclear transport factor 2 family protein [Candidatus Wallbacteria bacterium]